MSIAKVDEEINAVVSVIHQAAAATIPSSGQKCCVRNFIHDEELMQECQENKQS